jgi:hypothetical protein
MSDVILIYYNPAKLEITWLMFFRPCPTFRPCSGHIGEESFMAPGT